MFKKKYIRLNDHAKDKLLIRKSDYKKMCRDGYDPEEHLRFIPWAEKDYLDKIPERKYIETNGDTVLRNINTCLGMTSFSMAAAYYMRCVPTSTSRISKDDRLQRGICGEDTLLEAVQLEQVCCCATKKYTNPAIKYLLKCLRGIMNELYTPEKIAEYEAYCKKYIDSPQAWNYLLATMKKNGEQENLDNAFIDSTKAVCKLDDMHMFGQVANAIVYLEGATQLEDYVDYYALRTAKKIAVKHGRLSPDIEKDRVLSYLDTILADERCAMEVIGYCEAEKLFSGFGMISGKDRFDKLEANCKDKNLESLLKKYYPFLRSTEKTLVKAVRELWLEVYYDGKDTVYEKQIIKYEDISGRRVGTELNIATTTMCVCFDNLALYCADLSEGMNGYVLVSLYGKERYRKVYSDNFKGCPIDPNESLFPMDTFFEKHGFCFMDGSQLADTLKKLDGTWHEWEQISKTIDDITICTMWALIQRTRSFYFLRSDCLGGYTQINVEHHALMSNIFRGYNENGYYDAFYYRIGSHPQLCEEPVFRPGIW